MDASNGGTIASLHRRQLIVAVVVLVTSLALGIAFLWPRDTQNTIDEAEFSVFLVGPGMDELAVSLHGMGFAVESTERAENLESLLARAEAQGNGYVALHPPHLYDFEAIGGEAAPEGANMAVVGVAHRDVTFGGPAPGISPEGHAARMVGLTLALFEQPGYAKLLESGIPTELDPLPEPLREMEELETLAQVRTLQASYAEFSTLETQWAQSVGATQWLLPSRLIADPFDSTQAFPLHNGGVLLLVSKGLWSQTSRTSVGLEHEAAVLKYLSPEALKSEKSRADGACSARFGSAIEGVTVNAAGDAVAVRRRLEQNADGNATRWRVDAWTVTEGACPFQAVGLPDRSRDPRMMGLVSSDGVLWPLGSSGARPQLERDPHRPPRRRAVAWAGPGLIARTASFMRNEKPLSGIAFVEPDPVEPRAAFVSDAVVLGDDSGERVVQVDPLDAQRFLVTTSACRTVKIEFARPLREHLRPAKEGEPILRKADLSSRTFRRTWVVDGDRGGYPCGTSSFDRAGTVGAREVELRWYISDLTKGIDAPLVVDGHTPISDVLVAPDGSYAIAHVWVEIVGTPVLTSVWIDLDQPS